MDGDIGLAVYAGGEVLCGGGGDGGVALDDFGYNSAEGFDAEGERGYVEEEEIVDSGVGGAGEDLGLDGCSEGYYFVGVEVGVGLFVAGGELEEIVYEFLDGGDAGGAAYEDDFVDLRWVEAGVFEGLFAGGGGAGDDAGG